MSRPSRRPDGSNGSPPSDGGQANPPLNSQSYWETRFDSGDWGRKGGREMTRFLTTLAIDHFPPWLRSEVSDRRLSICDWGCAEGQGVSCLAAAFPRSEVVGVDISPTAIAKAQVLFPNLRFIAGDLVATDLAFDLIFSSNTLEHFPDPARRLEVLATHSREFLVLLVPFQEVPRHEEHCTTFDFGSFALSVGDFRLIHFAQLETASLPDAPLNTIQALLVYARASSPLARSATLATLVWPTIEAHTSVDQRLKAREHELAKAYEWAKSLAAEKGVLVAERDSHAQELQRRVEELTRIYDWTKQLQQTVLAKDEQILALQRQADLAEQSQARAAQLAEELQRLREADAAHVAELGKVYEWAKQLSARIEEKDQRIAALQAEVAALRDRPLHRLLRRVRRWLRRTSAPPPQA